MQVFRSSQKFFNALGLRLDKNSVKSPSLDINVLNDFYGSGSVECFSPGSEINLVFSQSRPFDLYELEQLLESVGWSRRPLRKVRRALDNSLLKVGLWHHDNSKPKLIGFARCTGDGVLEATVWDVAVHPLYQGAGLGKQIMRYILNELRKIGIGKVTLFADPGVVSFYKEQGWALEPGGNRCAFWYAS